MDEAFLVAVESRETHCIGSDANVARVRQSVRHPRSVREALAYHQTKLVTAVSELARNTLIHGGGGDATVEVVAVGPRRGVRVAFVDTGPGIANVLRWP